MLDFFKKLRISNPWNYKVPFLVSIPYFLLLVGNADASVIAQSLIWSVVTIIGIAGFAYLLNDFTDRGQDAKLSRENSTAGLPNITVFFYLFFFLCLSLLPWFIFFPLNKIIVTLLVAEIVLFILYSARPFRLKECGVLGIVADALYAHAIPAALAAQTFRPIIIEFNPELSQLNPFLGMWFLSLVLWQFFLGIRNILLHQLADLDNDQKSKTRTWVSLVGAAPVWNWIRSTLLPFELFLYTFFVLTTAVHVPWFFIIIPLFFLYTFGKIWLRPNENYPSGLREWLYRFVDEFIISWFPIGLLGAAALEEPVFLFVLGVHTLVFKNALKSILVHDLGLFLRKTSSYLSSKF